MSAKPMPSLPRLCPVCDWKRKDADAIATHNKMAATTGCRAYPQ
jgi:hypothetical protein